MRRRFRVANWIAGCLLPGLALLGCANQPLQTSGDSGAEKMLRRSSAEWDILFNARAGPQLAMLYAEDAYTMPPNSDKISGRPALRKDFDALFEAFNARHETQIDEYVIEGQRAVELAHYTLTLEPRAGGEAVVEKGRRIICWRLTRARWEIAWEMWNTQAVPQQGVSASGPGAADNGNRPFRTGINEGK